MPLISVLGDFLHKLFSVTFEKAVENGEELTEEEVAATLPEQEILIQAVSETMLPKLVADDIPLLHSLLSDVFPGIPYTRAEMSALKD